MHIIRIFTREYSPTISSGISYIAYLHALAVTFPARIEVSLNK